MKYWFIGILLLTISGCTKSDPGNENDMQASKIEIRLNAGIATRATETTFESRDQIGLHVVNQKNDRPGMLLQQGNHVDNMRFTYSGQWTPDKPIFWKDGTTKADFYCHYPYQAALDIHSCPFNTRTDQRSEENYKACEFLWGKTSNVSPTETAVDIVVRHVFSCAQIKLIPGSGFTAESLKNADIKVQINHILPDATINLSTGRAKAGGTPSGIHPRFDGTYYKAIIVPQTVHKSDLIVIRVNGKDYTLTQEHTFEANKRHTFTVTINKTNNGINVGVGKWEDDPIDHGGNAE